MFSFVGFDHKFGFSTVTTGIPCTKYWLSGKVFLERNTVFGCAENLSEIFGGNTNFLSIIYGDDRKPREETVIFTAQWTKA